MANGDSRRESPADPLCAICGGSVGPNGGQTCQRGVLDGRRQHWSAEHCVAHIRAKQRRFKGWRVVHEVFDQDKRHNCWRAFRLGIMGRDQAHDTANEYRRDPRGSRNIRVVRVYRKAG